MVGSNLAVVIPAFNEAKTLAPIIGELTKYASVILVDDCSADTTGEIAKNSGALVLRNQDNKGYEYSLNRGVEKAMEMGADAVITMDADGEHDPLDLPSFMEALTDENHPLVLGVRSKKQRFAESVMGFYVRVIHGPTDILCGFKGYSREVLEANNGFDSTQAVGTEVALNSIKRGFTFKELPISVKERVGRPHFDSSLKANIRILRTLFNLIGKDLASTFARSKMTP